MNRKAEDVPDPESANLKPILDALARRVGKAGQAEARAFATAFYRRMDADEARQHGADGWAALAADILDFARSRKRGKAGVRLFNPGSPTDKRRQPHGTLGLLDLADGRVARAHIVRVT